MADMILMICKYCGGKLVNIEGNLWTCESCGTKTLIEIGQNIEQTAESQKTDGFTMSVEHEGRTFNYKVRETAVFDIAFDRRATLADRFPTTVTLTVDGRPRGTFEHLPKTGKGSVSFETDGPDIMAYSTGKATFECADGTVTEKGDAEGSYIIAGLKVNIDRYNDEED